MHIPTFLAYIDPGTGSFMLQMLIAGLLSAGMAFKNVRYKIMSMFAKKAPEITADPPAVGPDASPPSGTPPTAGSS